jgi:hypothetical protein
MKKSSLVIGSLISALSLSACGNNTIDKIPEELSTEENTVVSTEMPTVGETSTEVDSSEPETVPCTFTQEKADALKEYLTSMTYLNATQNVENGNFYAGEYSNIIYNVKADTSNKIVQFDVYRSQQVDDMLGSAEYHYIRDYINDLTYQHNTDENAVWTEVDGTIMMIDWDFASFENDYDIWQYLVKDYATPIDTEGYVAYNCEYYVITEDADENMLSGIEYDSLGTQEITYIYYQTETGLIPATVSVEVQYFVGDDEYYARSTVQMGIIGETQMNMPTLGDVAN